MKKFLKLLTLIAVSAPISLSVVACSNQPNWNNIPIKPPQVPIDVTGFKGVDFQSMNIKNYNTVADLFKAIKDRFATSPWKDKAATTWTGMKDGQVIDVNPDEGDKLNRNATYNFEIKSNIDLPGDAKFIITITSSRDISDNMKVTNLDVIDDAKPKTVLIACVFKNMNLVSKINEIADEYLSPDNIEIDVKGTPNYDTPVNGTAILKSPTANYKTEPYFSGTVTVNFRVKLKKPTQPPVYLKTAITTPDLGIIPDKRYYTILMYVIIKNFVTKLDSLAEIVNNLNITDITDHSATLSAIDHSEYYKGSIPLTFTIQKNKKI